MIKMTPESLRQLTNVPTSLRMAGRGILNSRKGKLVVELPDGRKLLFDHGEPGPSAELHLTNYSVFSKALNGGDVGFAESYMDGDWTTSNLTKVLEFFSENFDAAGNLAIGRKFVRFANMVRHFFNRNSRSGAKRNIEAHYDLGNDFYEAWLDPSMTYSSAVFTDTNTSLEQAQAAKYQTICETLSIGPNSRVLEIGCGWGGFAEYAASNYGAHITCLTLSSEQQEYAVARIARADLADRVDIRLQDYRDHEGQYDCVASIEMFEAVGEQYWPDYFQKLDSFLEPGGRAALQIITMRDDLFSRYRKRADFIQRYVFPGGMLPSHSRLLSEFSNAQLNFEGATNFADDYAETLRRWSDSFNAQWNKVIEPLGFDLRFRRLWNFYLSYCEAGFRNGRINVGHYSLVKK